MGLPVEHHVVVLEFEGQFECESFVFGSDRGLVLVEWLSHRDVVVTEIVGKALAHDSADLWVVH